MKGLSLILGIALLATPAFAVESPEKIQKDNLQIGKAASGVNKKITFDTGDGASNKTIEVDNTTKDLSTNANLNIGGNLTATGNSTIDGTVTGKTGVKLGSGTNASKQITVDRSGFDPFMKWNETTQKWTYSNDGSVEKNIGSGSGGEGGVNILQNPSFEDGIAVDWTSSGGTFSSQTYSTPDPSGNDSVYSRFVASGAGQYFETTAHATPSYLNGGCLAKINYNTADAANWKLQVYDNSSNLLKEETLTVKSWQNGYASFPCPTAGTSIKLRVISIAAGQIEADKGYLGSENRTFQVQQASDFGSLSIAANASCLYSVSNTGAEIDFPVDSDCPSPTLTGKIKAPSTKIPAFVLPAGSAAGTYKVTVSADFYAQSVTGNSAVCSYGFSDGTTSKLVGSAGAGIGTSAANIGYSPTLVFDYRVPSTLTSDTQIKLISIGPTGGTRTCNIGVTGTPVTFNVQYVPSDSQTALRPEAQDWFIDANIGGANPDLGVASVASYTEITNASLDLVLNTGSASAKIACSSTNAATGTTCSAGSESIGIVFTPPQVGYYEACFDFTHSPILSAAGSIFTAFQAVETAPNAQAIIQEGKQRSTSGSQSPLTNSVVNSYPHKNCGYFYFSSVSEKAIRLMYEQQISGSMASASSSVYASRTASLGQNDIHVIIRPMLSAYNRPYLLPNEKLTLITSNYSATSNDSTISHSGSNATLTLPSAVTYNGKIYKIRSTGGNSLTVNFTGAETIGSGLTSFVVSGGATIADSVEVQSDGTGWIFLNDTGVRKDSCFFLNSGSASTDSTSGLCDKWVSSVSVGGTAGLLVIVPKTNIYSAAPNCNSNSQGSIGSSMGPVRMISVSTSSIQYQTVNTAGTAANYNQTISCSGKR